MRPRCCEYLYSFSAHCYSYTDHKQMWHHHGAHSREPKYIMRNTILTISLIAVLSGLTIATHAGTVVVWSASSFTNDPVGPYGASVDFQGGENLTTSIVTPGAGGDSSQAWEIVFNPSQPNINFQTTGVPYPASGNTNTFLANYNLEFDMQVTGNNVSPASGIQVSVFENQSGPNGYAVFGPNLLLPGTDTNVFVAGTGYQHYSIPLGSFKNNGISVAAATNFSIGIGYVSYPTDIAAPTETLDIANLQITMLTTPPPPPQPKLNVLAAKPALRIFQKASDAVYTQEGIGTVDLNQSWVGVATPSQPVSYAISFADFDTVANYTMNVQLCPGGNPDSPYTVYQSANDLLWTITSGGGAGGFTTAIAYKTNSPANANGGEINVALPQLITTSTNGRGTWTLTFTNDTDGLVTAPDGTKAYFSLDPSVPPQFANPLTVLFGTSAGGTGGFGQFIDLSRIAITNVVDGNEFDDFTMDDVLNTSLWDPNFSRDNPAYGNDAGSVIQVSSNTPSYWVNWNIPDDGYGLGTKASLNSGTNVWFSPDYYGSGTGATNTIPSLMGLSQKWTLIPNACFPTVDGSVGGTPSKSGFFRLLNPPPTQ
jgi:hypothetical protein